MSITHCIFTSFNKAYAAQAIIMAESFKAQHGDDVRIIALVVDVITDLEKNYFDIFDEIIDPRDLDIPNFHAWIFGLDIFEAATAIKPFAFCYLLEHYSHVTYVDPDTLCYSRLEEILDPSQVWDIALTPHQIEPKEERWLVESTELESLKFGVYNLGFLSIRATSNGKVIAKWWRDRCYEYGVADPKRGLFADQKFFDLAPALFAGVQILRHDGYNVASWNLRERRIEFSNNKLTANGKPLRFCHYTKASNIGATALERMLTKDSFFMELFYVYVIKLKEKNEILTLLNIKWHYGFFDDGIEISYGLRVKFRNLPNRLEHTNPFRNKVNFTD